MFVLCHVCKRARSPICIGARTRVCGIIAVTFKLCHASRFVRATQLARTVVSVARQSIICISECARNKPQ
ncbi:hypothetical protein [Lambdina fiscellaria nucleopolyhedrovirus]|uniref:Uncharacterized protein n=1 Tax=Lambdina fiscellaria nucleopolyhedrovirus TaxID=1642929 RepID=A0A0E3URS8_9ABAC|nr:hypothetical protein [Lambdina fiscellaria nucleopolyhedrovirus]AKC91749.1 hypothetical protein [Lambdina fiscellaria nucleopolyhedrovirus]